MWQKIIEAVLSKLSAKVTAGIIILAVILYFGKEYYETYMYGKIEMAKIRKSEASIVPESEKNESDYTPVTRISDKEIKKTKAVKGL